MTAPRDHAEEKSSVYFDLLEAFKGKGCAVCGLLARDVRAYVFNLLYENVNDVKMRSRLRQSLGFCRVHAALLIHGGNPLGIAIIYQDILQSLREILSDRDLVPSGDTKPCPACAHRRAFEQIYVGTAASHIHGDEFDHALHTSEGLCLDHLTQLNNCFQDDATRDQLLSLHATKLERSRSNLAEFLRKQDIQFRNETSFPEEQESCERAIDFLVGNNV